MGVNMDDEGGISSTFLRKLVRMSRKCDHTADASHFVSFVASLPIQTGGKQKYNGGTKVTGRSKEGADEDMETTFLKKLVEMARRCDNLTDADDFVGLIANLPIETSRKRHADGKYDEVSQAKKRRTEPVWQCNECSKIISNKANLKRHLFSVHKNKFAKKPKSTNAAKSVQFEKSNSSDRANKSNETLGHTAVKTRGAYTPKKSGGSFVESKNTNADQTCTLCNKKQVHLYKHYKNHNIDNPEEMFFINGNALLRPNRHTRHGEAEWFQKQREKVKNYKGGTCRFCEDLQLNDGELLKHHYKALHKVDPSCMEIVELLFRADRKALTSDDINDKSVKTNKSVCASKKVLQKKTIVQIDSKAQESNVLMYVCQCGVADDQYDSAIEHSQRHLALNYTPPVIKTCEKCEFAFEVKSNNFSLASHLKLHEGADLRHHDFKVVHYDYAKLLSSDWWQMFNGLSQIHKGEIMSSSIYKYTRSVKFRSNSSTGVPIYRCDMCCLCIDPSKVEIHCRNNICVRINKRSGHNCPECGFNFVSEKVLKQHREHHKIATTRLVTFNNKDDFSFNVALQKAENKECSNENELRANQEQIEQTKTPRNAISSNNIMQQCKHCKKYVVTSEYEAHNTVHENEHKLKMIRIARELNDSVSIQDNAGSNESVTEHAEVDEQMDGGDDNNSDRESNGDGGGYIETQRSDTNSCTSLAHEVMVVEAQIHMSEENRDNDRNACNVRININDVNNTDMDNGCINAQHTAETPEILLANMYGVNQTPVRDGNEEIQSTQELLSVLEKESSQNVNNENVIIIQNVAIQVRSNESQDMFVDDTVDNITSTNITDINKGLEQNKSVEVNRVTIINDTAANQVSSNPLKSCHRVDDTGMSLRDKLQRMLPRDDPVGLALTLHKERIKEKSLIARRMSSKD